MFDSYENYNPGFILMGIMIALSGLMLYPIPLIQSKLSKGRENKDTEIAEEESDTKVSYVDLK